MEYDAVHIILTNGCPTIPAEYTGASFTQTVEYFYFN